MQKIKNAILKLAETIDSLEMATIYKNRSLPIKTRKTMIEEMLAEQTEKKLDTELIDKTEKKIFMLIDKHGKGTSEGEIYWRCFDNEPRLLRKDIKKALKVFYKEIKK